MPKERLISLFQLKRLPRNYLQSAESKIQKGDVLSSERAVFDPTKRSMAKLGSKLDSFQSYSHLKKATTQKRNSLFDSHNTPNYKDLKQSLDCLKTLDGAYAALPSDVSSAPKASMVMKTASLVTDIAPRLTGHTV